MQRETTAVQVATTFASLLALPPKLSKLKHDFTLNLKITRDQTNQQFTKTYADSLIQTTIRKHLGKVGSAKYSYHISGIWPFDNQLQIQLQELNIDQFCIFWSALAFASKHKIELKALAYSRPQESYKIENQ